MYWALALPSLWFGNPPKAKTDIVLQIEMFGRVIYEKRLKSSA